MFTFSQHASGPSYHDDEECKKLSNITDGCTEANKASKACARRPAGLRAAEASVSFWVFCSRLAGFLFCFVRFARSIRIRLFSFFVFLFFFFSVRLSVIFRVRVCVCPCACVSVCVCACVRVCAHVTLGM